RGEELFVVFGRKGGVWIRAAGKQRGEERRVIGCDRIGKERYALAFRRGRCSVLVKQQPDSIFVAGCKSRRENPFGTSGPPLHQREAFQNDFDDFLVAAVEGHSQQIAAVATTRKSSKSFWNASR